MNSRNRILCVVAVLLASALLCHASDRTLLQGKSSGNNLQAQKPAAAASPKDSSGSSFKPRGVHPFMMRPRICGRKAEKGIDYTTQDQQALGFLQDAECLEPQPAFVCVQPGICNRGKVFNSSASNLYQSISCPDGTHAVYSFTTSTIYCINYKPAGTVCRAADPSNCGDLAETCTGPSPTNPYNAAFCPQDVGLVATRDQDKQLFNGSMLAEPKAEWCTRFPGIYNPDLPAPSCTCGNFDGCGPYYYKTHTYTATEDGSVFLVATSAGNDNNPPGWSAGMYVYEAGTFSTSQPLANVVAQSTWCNLSLHGYTSGTAQCLFLPAIKDKQYTIVVTSSTQTITQGRDGSSYTISTGKVTAPQCA